MNKPTIRIFLVRHGLSEANMDKTVNARKPDHAVELAGDPQNEDPTENGHAQAYLAGLELVKQLQADTTADPHAERVTSFGDGSLLQKRRIRLLVSPYLRTRQTAAGLRRALDEAGIVYDQREAMELREISFGLYDGLSDAELAVVFPREHAHYQKHVDFSGEIFAPMPMGESRIEVGDRVKSIFGTILRDAQDRRPDTLETATQKREKPLTTGPILDFVVVGHGVTNRQFLGRWMHWDWEKIEAEPNPGNCAIHLIEGVSGAGYRDERLFDGFRHVRGHEKQEQREDGHVLPGGKVRRGWRLRWPWSRSKG
jgi:2,3-bisphosphoglycerate-dependent phosphoglycerate mutase